MTIDAVAPTDASDAVRLLAAQFDEHQIALPAARLASAVAGLVGPAGRGAMLLAREAEHPVGLAALSYVWTLEHGGLVAWLDELYVVPDRRGHGVGSALLERAAALAREAGCLAIDLEVDREHSRAESLYERAGFKRLPRSRWVRKLVY